MPNCFEIHALLYKLWSGQIRTDAQMHAHTPNKNCKYVSLTHKLARQKLSLNYYQNPSCFEAFIKSELANVTLITEYLEYNDFLLLSGFFRTLGLPSLYSIKNTYSRTSMAQTPLEP